MSLTYLGRLHTLLYVVKAIRVCDVQDCHQRLVVPFDLSLFSNPNPNPNLTP